MQMQMQMPRAPAGWTVVTPHLHPQAHTQTHPPASAPPAYAHAHTQDFALRSPYPSAASSADDAERRRFASPAPSFTSGPARSPGGGGGGGGAPPPPPTAFRSPRPGLRKDTASRRLVLPEPLGPDTATGRPSKATRVRAWERNCASERVERRKPGVRPAWA